MSLRDNPLVDQPSLEDANDRIAALSRELEECRTEVEYAALQMKRLVTTDAATGLSNLAGVADRIEDSIDRLDRTGEPFGLMLVRIPELAAIAMRVDSCSYASAIRHVGEYLIAALRAVDHVGLVEGRSFLICLPELLPQDVDAVVERVRGALEAASAGLPGRENAGLHPEIGVVASHTKATVDVPMLLDILWTATNEARSGNPAVMVAPPSSAAEPSHL